MQDQPSEGKLYSSMKWIGKGVGMMLLVWFTVTGLLVLVYVGKDVSALAGPLGVVFGPSFFGGAIKAWADSYYGARGGNGATK